MSQPNQSRDWLIRLPESVILTWMYAFGLRLPPMCQTRCCAPLWSGRRVLSTAGSDRRLPINVGPLGSAKPSELRRRASLDSSRSPQSSRTNALPRDTLTSLSGPRIRNPSRGSAVVGLHALETAARYGSSCPELPAQRPAHSSPANATSNVARLAGSGTADCTRNVSAARGSATLPDRNSKKSRAHDAPLSRLHGTVRPLNVLLSANSFKTSRDPSSNPRPNETSSMALGLRALLSTTWMKFPSCP